MPTILDLVWKPSADAPTLPTDTYPVLAPAVYRNDGYSIHFTLSDGDDPYVPEGTLTAQIRKARLAAGATPGEPLASFDVTVGGDNGNEVTLDLDETITEALPDSAYWDLQESFVDGPPRTWFTGRVKAWGDITRDEDGS